MTLNLKTIFGGLAIAVVSGLIVSYITRKMGSPQQNCTAQGAWNQVVSRSALPNANRTGANPAYTYGGGAPVTNYRPYLRVGQMEVPAQ